MTPFARAVSEGMARRGLGLRELGRRAGLDPSLLSKMLAGKRPPPGEADLRRLAGALEIDPVELVVAAGLLPSEWEALRRDPGLLRAVHALAAGRRAAPAGGGVRPGRPAPRPPGLSEELL